MVFFFQYLWNMHFCEARFFSSTAQKLQLLGWRVWVCEISLGEFQYKHMTGLYFHKIICNARMHGKTKLMSLGVNEMKVEKASSSSSSLFSFIFSIFPWIMLIIPWSGWIIVDAKKMIGHCIGTRWPLHMVTRWLSYIILQRQILAIEFTNPGSQILWREQSTANVFRWNMQ